MSKAVSASYDQTLRVWDVETGETLRTLEGHTRGVLSVASLGGDRVVSASYDQTLRVWDVETGESVASLYLDAPAGGLAIICSGSTVVVAGDGRGRVHFLDLVEMPSGCDYDVR